MRWSARLLHEAETELANLPSREQDAITNAIKKLEAIGPSLPYPHSSDVKSANNLRELRPRSGRSPWRAFYRQIGTIFAVAAIGPEALHDRRGFTKAVALAEQRLDDLEED